VGYIPVTLDWDSILSDVKMQIKSIILGIPYSIGYADIDEITIPI
jgi:hypothetical protein